MHEYEDLHSQPYTCAWDLVLIYNMVLEDTCYDVLTTRWSGGCVQSTSWMVHNKHQEWAIQWWPLSSREVTSVIKDLSKQEHLAFNDYTSFVGKEMLSATVLIPFFTGL